ncbi:hypothetical protein HMPREF9120_01983 [Neisseria sp. oral taxon 020 str. F0370]|nr:hypothetical protein HMPREF9120_01983 [Neisseria sp. oral taxon 020 str. F0370]
MPPIGGNFNAADAVLGRKSRQNVDCQYALGFGRQQGSLKADKPAFQAALFFRFAISLRCADSLKGRLKAPATDFRRP